MRGTCEVDCTGPFRTPETTQRVRKSAEADSLTLQLARRSRTMRLHPGWTVAALLLVCGCQSTALNRQAKNDAGGMDVAWKKAAVPSSASAQDHWTNPPKQDDK